MKKGLLRRACCLLTGLVVSSAPHTQADVDIYWDLLGGFTPSAVTIKPGEAVFWTNDDLFELDFELTLEGYQPHRLEYLETVGAIFNTPGDYSFSSDYGDSGVVHVNNPPAGIVLSAPRIANGEFQFDVAGLTVGRTNVLETSANLTTWTSIATNVATSATVTVTNAATPGPRFYRIFENQ